MARREPGHAERPRDPMTCAPIAVHGSASLRHAKGISGLSRAAVIASALRSGLYDEKIEARLQDDGSPRLLDLVPTVEESDGVELPLIRLRSVVPVDPDFEGLEAAAAIYDSASEDTVVTGRDPGEDHSDNLAVLNETMIAALSLTLTDEMRTCAGASIRHVCGVTTPMPWAKAQAAVLDNTAKGMLKHVMSRPIEPEFAERLTPTCSISQPGRTMTGVPIHTIESAFAYMDVDRLPSPMEAMRTFATVTHEGQKA